MTNKEEYYHLELPIEVIRIIHRGLSIAVDKWPGGDPQEQDDLKMMRDNFYRILLEDQFIENK